MKLDLLPLSVMTVFRKGERKAGLSQGHRRTSNADVEKAILNIGFGANREASPVGSADLDGKQMHVDGLGRQIVEANRCGMDIEMMEQLIDSACKIQLSACFTCAFAALDRIERDCGIKTERQRFAEVLAVAYADVEHCGSGFGQLHGSCFQVGRHAKRASIIVTRPKWDETHLNARGVAANSDVVAHHDSIAHLMNQAVSAQRDKGVETLGLGSDVLCMTRGIGRGHLKRLATRQNRNKACSDVDRFSRRAVLRRGVRYEKHATEHQLLSLLFLSLGVLISDLSMFDNPLAGAVALGGLAQRETVALLPHHLTSLIGQLRVDLLADVLDILLGNLKTLGAENRVKRIALHQRLTRLHEDVALYLLFPTVARDELLPADALRANLLTQVVSDLGTGALEDLVGDMAHEAL